MGIWDKDTSEADQPKALSFLAGVIEHESPAYYTLIQKRYDLLDLWKWQRYVLCESIVSTPIYHQEGVEFITDFTVFNPGNLSPTRKPLHFRTGEYSDEKLTFECFICKVKRLIKKEKKQTNLYVTQSYDNKNSIYVLKAEEDGIILDKYFLNVPELMNVHDTSTVEDISH